MFKFPKKHHCATSHTKKQNAPLQCRHALGDPPHRQRDLDRLQWLKLFKRSAMSPHCSQCLALIPQTTAWHTSTSQTPHGFQALPPLHDPTSTTAWFERHGHRTTLTHLDMPKRSLMMHGLASFQPQHCRGVTIQVHTTLEKMVCFSWLEANPNSPTSQAFTRLNDRPLGRLLFQKTWQRQRFAYLKATHTNLMGRRSDFIHTSGARVHLVEFFA